MTIDQLGPYGIIRKLGHGGMGTVFEAVNRETGEPAAVKLLAAALAQEEGFRERFEIEIETLRKLHHPNIVRLFGFGEQDGQLFYAMELVDGCSLEQQLKRGRRFDWREVTRIGIETCRALRHAHDRGVIHRDIKPANLMMAADEQVKLTDFGIARLFGNTHLTSVGSVLGTAEYMAPEQAEGQPVGPRADLYSLGAVFYVLLTHRPLFRAKSLPEVLHKQRFERPDPVSQHAVDVPAVLEQIIAQLLEKDPDRRIPNPTILSRQLQAMEHALSLGPDSGDASPAGAGGDSLGGEADVIAVPHAAAADRSDPGQLPPTRPVDTPSREPAATQLPKPPAADLPVTKATAAFKGLDLPSEGHSHAPPNGREAALERRPGGRFTTVAEEELDRIESKQGRHALISLQTWALAAGLIAVGLSVRYLLQAPSKDDLYDRIIARTADDSIASLVKAKDDVEEFLRQFPGDPRCGQLREHQKEIELHDLEKKFRRVAKGLEKTDNLVPIQRAYLEAINYVRLDPERGMAKLQALVDLYDYRTDKSGPTGQCLELARRRLAKLREELDRQTAQHLALVQDRLEQAEQLSRTEPDRAQAMYRAVIELYQDKPWAAEAVGRAREALAAGPEEK